MWSLMDVDQRARALQRADALVRYDDGRGEVQARTAAADAGVTLVRFYQMNARWRDGRSLAALGVGAQPEQTRRSQFTPKVNAALQSAVAELVRDDEASVRALALRLADIASSKGVPEKELPGHNTLRGIVERARRDRHRRREVGSQLLLDHAACGILRDDGAPWAIFVIADSASQLILGAAPGEAAAAGRGYADAARDAKRRLAEPTFPKFRWSDRLLGVQVVPGSGDADGFAALQEEAASIGVGMNLTAGRKAGRYLEDLAGRALGVLPIWPSRLGATGLPAWAAERVPTLDRDRAQARIILAVDDHNAALLGALDAPGDGDRPDGLTRLLEVLAA